MLSVSSVMAQSATWLPSPSTGNWNTAANWTGATVPNGSSDVATFGTSTTAGVSLSANTQVDAIVFNAGGSAFTITARPTFTLTLSGTGIINNSGNTQNVVADADVVGNLGRVFFTGIATAGSNTAFTNSGSTLVSTWGGLTAFHDNSTAGYGAFTNYGALGDHAGAGQTIFYNSSTASHGTFTNIGGTIYGAYGGLTVFYNTANAGSGTFNNLGSTISGVTGGGTQFHDGTTAANGTFINSAGTVSNAWGGGVLFGNSQADTANAATGTFINNGADVGGALGGGTTFFYHTSAENGHFTNNGGTAANARGGYTQLIHNSTGANGTFISNGGTAVGASSGAMYIFDSATAGNSTLIANGGANGGNGGLIDFRNDSTGGTASVKLFGNGQLDISGHNAPGVTIGSLEGSGVVSLGASRLAAGSNNRSTTFSGMIKDSGGQNSATGGSLTKIGTGTLTLSGSNIYTGGTTITAGTVLANNTSGSAFGSGTVSVSSGATLGGSGFIGGTTIIASGGHIAPGNSPSTLTFINGLTFTSGAILDFQLGTTSDRIDVIGGVLTGPSGTGGITLNLTNSGGFSSGEYYTLFTFVSGQSTSFEVTDFSFGSIMGNTVSADYSLSLTPTSLSLIYTGTAIPEPSTYAAIFGLTVLGFAAYRRRKKSV